MRRRRGGFSTTGRLNTRCASQYLQLEKTIAAGADLAICQLGYDARTLRVLKRYMGMRGVPRPVLGTLYVLDLRGAAKMAKGEPRGCWVAPDLLDQVRRERAAKDGGLGARLERAARMVAILRGLGYSGAYTGGTHEAGQASWIIRRAEALVPAGRSSPGRCTP